MRGAPTGTANTFAFLGELAVPDQRSGVVSRLAPLADVRVVVGGWEFAERSAWARISFELRNTGDGATIVSEETMQKNKVFVAIHGNWATRNRVESIGEGEEALIKCAVIQQLQRLNCRFVAFGTSTDHVHVLFWINSAVTLGEVFRVMKAASSVVVSRESQLPFRWQHGFGAFSVSRPLLRSAVNYVTNQRQIHAERRAISCYE